MIDLLERLTAENPVRDCDPPPIEGVWRKVAELDEGGGEGRSGRTARRFGIARSIVPTAAVVIPALVVIAVILPLLGASHQRSGPAAPGVRGGGTLDTAAQALAARELAGRPGAIVAIDPRTGAVTALYGNPSPGTPNAAGSPVVAAAGAEYPPADVFDLVTATAGLDTGAYSPAARIVGRSPMIVSGTSIDNNEGGIYGPITVAQALEASVNTVFAQVGQHVGRQAMATYMQRFGFYAPWALRGAPVRSPASGVWLGGRLLLPTDRRVNLARAAIGQGGLSVTPVQMAMVAAAIANAGQMVSPHLDSGRLSASRQVMSPATAHVLSEAMSDVVKQGTGTPAALTGVSVAGKTGTAHPGHGRTVAWFVGFAPADHPTVAIAVVLGDLRQGFGGVDAGPIAGRMIRALLAHR